MTTERVPALFAPLTLRSLTVPNRLWIGPMCQYKAEDGVVSPWHLVHLGGLAVGHPGLIVAEMTAVSPEGRITLHDTGIWRDDQAEAFKPIVDFVHDQSVPIALQLGHTGRKGSIRSPHLGRGALPVEEGGWQTAAPSATSWGRLPTPHALTRDEILRIVDLFAAAARRAVASGFDAIEIHAAHGYLLHQFMSPLSNVRDDEYNDGPAGRLLATTQVLQAVRAAIPSGTPLFVRISATEWVPGGLTTDDAAWAAPHLVEVGADLISVSSAGNDPAQEIPTGPAYHVPLSRAVSAATDAPVAVAGRITSPEQAEGILVDHGADVIVVGRAALRQSAFPLRARAELGVDVNPPIPYELAWR